MNVLERYSGETVVGIGAHPDDLEIGMGGTLARLARGGARVIMVAVAVPGQLDERLGEAQRAADILGARMMEVLERDQPRRVEDLHMYELVGMIDRVIRAHQPSALFTHSDLELHHDHILVHRAVLSSMRLRPMDIYFFAPSTCKPSLRSWQPRVWVDITETIDLKIQAISAHDSQFQRRGICVDRFRQQAQAQGIPLGIPFAEGLDLMCLRS